MKKHYVDLRQFISLRKFTRLAAILLAAGLSVNLTPLAATTTDAVDTVNRIEQQKSRVIKGTVQDKNHEPIIGVTVLVVGQSTGVITDMDGKFSIEVPSGSQKLSFSYIGYTSQEVDLKGKTQLDV